MELDEYARNNKCRRMRIREEERSTTSPPLLRMKTRNEKGEMIGMKQG